jgi:Holliday junction resolvasome RuvABC endonuclease subunit
MTQIADQRSIVGVDPGSRGLAFVFFERGTLLDWGTRRRDGDELALLDQLLDRCNAEVLVLEDPDAERAERRPRVRRLLRLMARHAAERGITVQTVCRYDVRKAWTGRGKTRKHAVAAEIGAMFPEIEPLIPRIRKVFNAEQARADIFDAVSLVLHAFPTQAPIHPEREIAA